MNANQHLKKVSQKLLVVILLAGLLMATVSAPALADEDTINLCENASQTADTVKNIFLIMQILGPIFGTMFFVGLSVAGAASIKDKYGEQRRKVLLLGFGVPVAIVFLEAIADNVLIDQSIDCFFPGGEE